MNKARELLQQAKQFQRPVKESADPQTDLAYAVEDIVKGKLSVNQIISALYGNEDDFKELISILTTLHTAIELSSKGDDEAMQAIDMISKFKSF